MWDATSTVFIFAPQEGFVHCFSRFMNYNKDFLLLCVFAFEPGWSKQLNKTKITLKSNTLFVLFPSQWKSHVLTIHSRTHHHDLILPLLSKWMRSSKHEDPFSTKYLLMPVDSQITKHLFIVVFLWIAELFAVRAYFSLTVSIVLIMHGACVHRALLLVLLRWICSFGLLWRCQACVWITASSVSQSPAPTCTSPLMNSPAAHYWRHFTVV